MSMYWTYLFNQYTFLLHVSKWKLGLTKLNIFRKWDICKFTLKLMHISVRKIIQFIRTKHVQLCNKTIDIQKSTHRYRHIAHKIWQPRTVYIFLQSLTSSALKHPNFQGRNIIQPNPVCMLCVSKSTKLLGNQINLAIRKEQSKKADYHHLEALSQDLSWFAIKTN